MAKRVLLGLTVTPTVDELEGVKRVVDTDVDPKASRSLSNTSIIGLRILCHLAAQYFLVASRQVNRRTFS